jgi:hypothetical protein
MKKSTEYPPPDPRELRKARLLAGITQTQAGALIYRSLRCWQNWEYGARPMDAQLYEGWLTKLERVKRKQLPHEGRKKPATAPKPS